MDRLRQLFRGGTPRLRSDLAFELGRAHRTRDSKGPRGPQAAFEDLALVAAYVRGYTEPYWWERRLGSWRDYHPDSKRIAYYRFWRAVYGTPAGEAWAQAKKDLAKE